MNTVTNDLAAVAYVSSAATTLSEAALEALLLDARAYNRNLGVTGVLLHDDGNFFQYFEGPVASVADVHERIRRARLHHGIFEMFSGPIASCQFPGWVMGFAQTPRSDMLRLSQADWNASKRSLQATEALPPGLQLLKDYWSLIAR